VDALTFVGTATVLLRLGPFTVLTDPNFLHRGERAALGYGLRSRRVTEPALQAGELPRLDAVILSHHHGDHFDDRAARELDRSVPILSTPGAVRKLRRQGFGEAVPLRTWQSEELAADGAVLTITALPAKHAPGPLQALLPSVMGSLLHLRRADGSELRIYVTGDTLMHEGLYEIGRRFPAIDVCVLHLGGTRIGGVLLTMDDKQGVRAIGAVHPRFVVPVHYDDYGVFRSPLADFVSRYRRQRPAVASDTVLTVVNRGESFDLVPA
jgi:L-ascorbate metabolism protein UlaG (beta-lactamase superfamily)